MTNKKTKHIGKKTIFLVDDDPMFLALFKDFLTDKHPEATIHEFTSGEDCLAALDRQPDVVLLDYYLDSTSPDAANGLVILEALKEKMPYLPVVMLSGQGKYGVAAQTIAHGAVHYIMKDDDAFANANEMINSIFNEQ